MVQPGRQNLETENLQQKSNNGVFEWKILNHTTYMGDVRLNDQAELMSINRELLGNSLIKALFILLFVNQIICLTCGLPGLLRSFLSSEELGCWNFTHRQGLHRLQYAVLVTLSKNQRSHQGPRSVFS